MIYALFMKECDFLLLVNTACWHNCLVNVALRHIRILNCHILEDRAETQAGYRIYELQAPACPLRGFYLSPLWPLVICMCVAMEADK